MAFASFLTNLVCFECSFVYFRNMKNSREKIATMEQDIVKCEQDLKDMQAERDQTEQDAKELLKCVEAITLELEQGTEEFAGILDGFEKKILV